MTSDRRFEQELPALLDHLYMGPMPTYRDNVLRQTARTRQRPAWTFLERWLPVVDIARQPIIAPRMPWRAIGLGLVLLAVLIRWSRHCRGRASEPPEAVRARPDGLVAYASRGDIYTVDPASGLATAVVTGPDTDQKPVWSGDGTHFAFTRSAAGGADSLLFVARTDERARGPHAAATAALAARILTGGREVRHELRTGRQHATDGERGRERPSTHRSG